jgi:hypothetical protein
VTLSTDLRRWKAKASSFGSKTTYRLGPLFERLFPARDGRSFLSPVRAELRTSWSPEEAAWEACYTFALSLQHDGVSHEILAEGRGRSNSDRSAADRTALEDCVARIYAQVSAVQTARNE